MTPFHVPYICSNVETSLFFNLSCFKTEFRTSLCTSSLFKTILFSLYGYTQLKQRKIHEKSLCTWTFNNILIWRPTSHIYLTGRFVTPQCKSPGDVVTFAKGQDHKFHLYWVHVTKKVVLYSCLLNPMGFFTYGVQILHTIYNSCTRIYFRLVNAIALIWESDFLAYMGF